MCCNQSNGTCCPDGKVFQEEVCGNFGQIDEEVWTAPEVNDYIQGTFEVFNAGPGIVRFTVHTEIHDYPHLYTVAPGNSLAISVNNPSYFIVQTSHIGDNHATGKWCITLYKRVFQ